MHKRGTIGKSGRDSLAGTSYTNANGIGMFAGLIGGLGLAALFGIPWWGVVVASILGAVVGIIGSIEDDGLYLYQRVLFSCAFWLKQRAGATILVSTARNTVQSRKQQTVIGDDGRSVVWSLEEDANA